MVKWTCSAAAKTPARWAGFSGAFAIFSGRNSGNIFKGADEIGIIIKTGQVAGLGY